MTANQRKACLQAQTVIAAELLQLVTEGMLLPRRPFLGLVQERAGSSRELGVPLAYVKSLNPPGRTSAHQQELMDTLAQHRADLVSI
jgi:hypothetical protein